MNRLDAAEPVRASRQASPRHHRPPAALDALVMNLLKESNWPLTAYDVVWRSAERGSFIAPIQVYRVLNRFVAANRLQRIELLSAYLPLRGEPQRFIVCRSCRAAETFPVPRLLPAARCHCESAGFALARPVLEVSGVCADCARQASNIPRNIKSSDNTLASLTRRALDVGRDDLVDAPCEVPPPGR